MRTTCWCVARRLKNSDKLPLLNTDAVNFVMEMAARGKPIAAMPYTPWMLIGADLVRSRTVTSWHSLEADLVKDAGASWVNQEVGGR